ncbi:hypothetical protein NO2_0479 [Candidatus Termititenax persephonae]|uniref:Uncharacterized protein n=1 Tax=Candidatus Termititenax persephonae TaxID=2218525 RepID=A0A388TFM1_9BACT|nr:hypothetical protein NO2_0479 [Candidatus Termititenax persephonae]
MLGAGRLWAADDLIYLGFGFLALGLFAYLAGNAFPGARLAFIRGKIYKLFFSTAAAYGLLVGVVVLLGWSWGCWEILRPWLIYFTLAFGLIAYAEPRQWLLRHAARGPLTTLLPRVGALSSCVALAVLAFFESTVFAPLPVLCGALAALIFFGLWLVFIRCARLAADSLLARLLQLGFIWGLTFYLETVSLIAGALFLGLANAVFGLEVWKAKDKIDLRRLGLAAVFVLYFGLNGLPEFSFLTLGGAALILLGRLLLFRLYNFFAQVYLLGREFSQRVNSGLQVSEGLVLFLILSFGDKTLLTVALLVLLIENLFYPLILRRILRQSGELRE